MAFQSGTKLGAYEIQSPLGAGGMGEVYRARDTRLGRDVALKVLPEAFARDAERLGRFRREAQVLASLNHPNIAAIYGFEDSGATHALVMELVEGPTLAERIKQGAIPIEEALPIAKQIAETLEYAHERGIVHRDLKPANIKLASNDKIAQNDAVKILDFGLAKALEGDASSVDISSSPTITRMATQAGIILGTAAYMSPEQAKGKSVDRRTDIWAFGCVVYEMLTGKQAFTGETVTDTLAAVIMKDPDLSTLPANTTQSVRSLLQRCLKKDARQRLQSIGDARIAIEEILSGATAQYELAQQDSSAGGIKPPLQMPVSWWRSALPWALAGLIVGALIAGVGAWAWLSPREGSAPPAMAYISPPPGTSFRSFGFGAGPAVVSPDGKEIAFSATDEKGATQIWLRPLAGGDARALAETEDGAMPFWSADGQSLGFFAGGKLKTTNVQNGTVQVLADVLCDEGSYGAAWSANGVILFSSQCNAPIERISAGGGTPKSLAETTGGASPAFLPGGDKFLYVSNKPNQPSAIRMASLSTGKSQLVLDNASSPQFASGYLLFLREGKVFARQFDAASGEVTGEALPLAEALTFSASNNGVLVSQGGTGNARLQWFDRSGNVLGTIGDVAHWIAPRISPKGKQVLAIKEGPASWDFWSYPVTGGIGTRLTFGQGWNAFSVWSPDGKYIAYGCQSGGSMAICRKPSDGSGAEETVLKLGSDVARVALIDWSPDGRYLSFDESDAHRHWSCWAFPLVGSGKPFRTTPVAADQYDGDFSPDGHWMAYFSYETGRPEVFVVPFPPSGGKYQISQTGGWIVKWAAGDKLFYMTIGNRLMEADLATSGKSLQVKSIHALFQLSLPASITPLYDVTPDGQRFIVATSADPAASSSITLLTNWPALLEK